MRERGGGIKNPLPPSTTSSIKFECCSQTISFELLHKQQQKTLGAKKGEATTTAQDNHEGATPTTTTPTATTTPTIITAAEAVEVLRHKKHTLISILNLINLTRDNDS